MLPQCQLDGINQVIGVLTKAATKYISKYGKAPVLFIDGIDILAKREEELCKTLITQAKILANGSKIKIVLISSEGTILPLMKEL